MFNVTKLLTSKNKFVVLFIFYDAQSISVEHEAYLFEACSDTEEEVFIGYDEEEMWHTDFDQKKGVVTFPELAGNMTFPGFYELGVRDIAICKSDLQTYKKVFKNPPPQLGKTLECARNFYHFLMNINTACVLDMGNTLMFPLLY